MIAPSGGFGAWGTSRGNGVLYITFRRTRTASLGLKRWAGSVAAAPLSCRNTAKSSSTQMPRPYVPTIKSLSVDRDVAVLRGRKIEQQRLPVVAVVEGHVHRALRAGEQQTAPLGIRSNDARERAARQRRRQSRDDPCPRFPVVTRAVDGRGVVAAKVCVERGVRGARVEVGRLDRREDRASPYFDARDCNVAP